MRALLFVIALAAPLHAQQLTVSIVQGTSTVSTAGASQVAPGVWRTVRQRLRAPDHADHAVRRCAFVRGMGVAAADDVPRADRLRPADTCRRADPAPDDAALVAAGVVARRADSDRTRHVVRAEACFPATWSAPFCIPEVWRFDLQ